MSKWFTNGYALIIGVGADLPNTADDAQGLADILKDEGRCAYPPGQVQCLTGPAATRDTVLAALDALAQRTDAEATVVICFSGHGYKVSTSMDDVYFLMPYGYDLNKLKTTAIKGAEFAAKLRVIPAKKLLVLLDCCHGGGVGDAKAPGLELVKSPLPPEDVALLAEGSGRVLIASSQEDELSYAGRPYSAFTLALIEALAGVGVAKKDGYVRVADVALHARQVVPGRTKQRQHPILHFEHADNFVLAYYAGGDTQPKGLPFPVESVEIEPEPGAWRVGGDMVMGDKTTVFDQRGQTVGTQTNIAGNVTDPVLSGQFGGPVAVGGGEAVDMRGTTSAVYKPSGPVTQYFADQITVITGKTALPIPTAPSPPPHFVDREAELEKLATRLTADEPTAATALQGMGGSGKSALAKKLAYALVDYFPGGVLWASLGMQPDQFHILESWALAAGGDVRAHTDLFSRAAAVRALLASRGKMLAVLDDVWEYECPQLLMRHALPASATVVITTRDADLGKRLRCQIERIDTLPKADALALLEKLLGPLGEYEAAAQEIARLAGYVPLALELAAGLADDPADLPDVARRLRERPALGVLTMGTGEQRRESIEACFSLSYTALLAEMQRRFRALGAFASSPFDAAAAAAVWGLGVDEADLETASQSLRFLARRSLLSRQEGRLYSQHSLLRAYALALLEREGEVEAIARQHAAHYLAVVQEGDWRAIEATFRQIRHGWEAIKIHAPEQVADYLLALISFLRSSGRWNDFVEWAKYVLEQEPQDVETQGRLLNEMGYVYWLWGRCEDALNCLRPALSLCREAHNRQG
ncbi:MAG: caspase family protein, partial [Chloroflexota bacterium]|nr:caspase family protein [Chloroflexota bacterium]